VAAPGSVGCRRWRCAVPGSSGSDDRGELPQDRRGDHGLGLGDGELILFRCGQVSEPGGVDRVGALGAPDCAPGGQSNARGGQLTSEHFIAALRCLHNRAVRDGLMGDNPARQALALRPCDLDVQQCLVLLREKGQDESVAAGVADVDGASAATRLRAGTTASAGLGRRRGRDRIEGGLALAARRRVLRRSSLLADPRLANLLSCRSSACSCAGVDVPEMASSVG
jgi:hypothetical protein